MYFVNNFKLFKELCICHCHAVPPNITYQGWAVHAHTHVPKHTLLRGHLHHDEQCHCGVIQPSSSPCSAGPKERQTNAILCGLPPSEKLPSWMNSHCSHALLTH